MKWVRQEEEYLKKHVCILMGSPRKNGNIAQLLSPVIEELKRNNCICDLIWRYDFTLLPCVVCWNCQRDWSRFGCCQKDDMQRVFDTVLDCEFLLHVPPSILGTVLCP